MRWFSYLQSQTNTILTQLASRLDDYAAYLHDHGSGRKDWQKTCRPSPVASLKTTRGLANQQCFEATIVA
jgi:hypothetical protein